MVPSGVVTTLAFMYKNVYHIIAVILMCLVSLQYYSHQRTRYQILLMTHRVPRNNGFFSVLGVEEKERDFNQHVQLPNIPTESANKLNGSLPLCPLVSPFLVGELNVTTTAPPIWSKLNQDFPAVMPGGHWKPLNCVARSRVAVIVPFRDRDEHLRLFLLNLHAMLMRQQLDYQIYIIEQSKPDEFNRAKLFNAGYAEALKDYNWTCFVFHDVDLIPEDDRNIYTCAEFPLHLSVAIDKFNYNLLYPELFGGASAINRTVFENLNGFSNLFFGWGGEDDDMAKRLSAKKYPIMRYPKSVARYKMLEHKKAEPNKHRFLTMKQGESNLDMDGLNSLSYTVISREKRPLYTHVLLNLISKTSPIDAEVLAKQDKQFAQIIKEIGNVDLAMAYLAHH